MTRNALVASSLAAAALFGAAAADDGQGPIQFCHDKSCQDCPVSLTVEGTGYPECVVYDSDQIFGNGDFAESDSGGWEAYLDVQDPGDGCKHIITTPADVDVEGCGVPVASFSHAACSVLDMDVTFMYQWCCGSEDCEGAGVSKRGTAGNHRQTLTVNGTVVEPIQKGSPPSARKRMPQSLFGRSSLLNREEDDGKCDGDWTPDDGAEEFTTESDDRQVVFSDFRGGSVTITETRSQTWTSETSASLGFADVLSLGISMTESFSESVEDSTAYTFDDETGQIGSVVFTPTLKCSTGHGTCDGEDVSGTFCTGYKIGDNVAGTYSIVVHD